MSLPSRPFRDRRHAAAALTLAALLAASAAAARADDEPPSKGADTVEGAIGLILGHHAAYPGSSTMETRLTPAGFLRWGRLSVTGAGGFTTRRRDDVERGLGAELVRRERVRLSLNLRYDNGRSESDSPELAGLGDVKRTLRARLALRWDVDEDWRVGLAASVDALNRVGGYVLDLNLSRQWPLPHDSVAQLGVGISAAGDRFLQAWFGVTPEQSARSGYPVYRVPEGLSLRDASVSGTLRTDFGPRWSGFASLGLSRVLGAAADGPLTHRRSNANLATGLVWRF